MNEAMKQNLTLEEYLHFMADDKAMSLLQEIRRDMAEGVEGLKQTFDEISSYCVAAQDIITVIKEGLTEAEDWDESEQMVELYNNLSEAEVNLLGVLGVLESVTEEIESNQLLKC